jgi:hypothetical protein
MGIRQTHTFVVLEISQAAFDEIKAKLEAAGYQHAFNEDEDGLKIDMQGIAVAAEKPPVKVQDMSPCVCDRPQSVESSPIDQISTCKRCGHPIEVIPGFYKVPTLEQLKPTPEEQHQLESLLQWQEQSAKSKLVLGVPFKTRDS